MGHKKGESFDKLSAKVRLGQHLTRRCMTGLWINIYISMYMYINIYVFVCVSECCCCCMFVHEFVYLAYMCVFSFCVYLCFYLFVYASYFCQDLTRLKVIY